MRNICEVSSENLLFGSLNVRLQFKKNDLNIKKNEIKIAVIPGLSKIIYDYSTLCNTQ